MLSFLQQILAPSPFTIVDRASCVTGSLVFRTTLPVPPRRDHLLKNEHGRMMKTSKAIIF